MNKTTRGFSLIELLIVLAILAIVTTWGYTSYRDTVLKSHRSEGIGELLIIADNMERYFANQGTYAGAVLGTAANAVHGLNSANGYYKFTIASANAIAFALTAIPQGGQADDTKCATLTYNSGGTKSATGSTPTKCW